MIYTELSQMTFSEREIFVSKGTTMKERSALITLWQEMKNKLKKKTE